MSMFRVERAEAGQMALFRRDRCHTSGGGEHRAQVVFRWLAKLCATAQPQAAHKAEGGLTTSSTLVMRGCDPLVLTLGFRFKPTADLGSAWNECADTADIPSALPASSTPHSPRRARSGHASL